MFCTRARSCARADDAKIAVGMCNAKPGSHLNVDSDTFLYVGSHVFV